MLISENVFPTIVYAELTVMEPPRMENVNLRETINMSSCFPLQTIEYVTQDLNTISNSSISFRFECYVLIHLNAFLCV